MDTPLELPKEAFNGQTLKLKYPTDTARFFVDGKVPTFFENGEDFIMGIGLYKKNAVLITGVLESDPTKYFAESISVSRKGYKAAAKLRLPSNLWKKIKDDNSDREKYRKKRSQIWQNESGYLTDSCWDYPLKSRINSPFGKPRTLPSGRTYFHSGVDLRAPAGTPLQAIADGQVVLAEEVDVPGKTVIVYHGGGIHSQFMHMKELQVLPGQKVKRGETLGLSGSSGRVEGPHLHWEMHWKGRRLDPHSFVQTVAHLCNPS